MEKGTSSRVIEKQKKALKAKQEDAPEEDEHNESF